MRIRTRSSLGIAAALGALAVAVAAQAGGAAGTVLLCHGTASATNPYVLISVSENALQGHFDGTAPGHGEQNNPDLFYDTTSNGTCEEQAAENPPD